MRVVGARSEFRPGSVEARGAQNAGKKKGHSFVPRTPRLGAADAAKKRAAFRSPTAPLGRETEGYPAQAQGPGGGGKASEPPHSLEDSPVPCEPARSVIGGWWLLMTHQLSLEQSGTSSASLDHRAKTQSLPPQARILGPEPQPVCPLGIE